MFPSIASLLATSWKFLREQTALNGVALWLLAFPLTALNVVTRLMQPMEGDNIVGFATTMNPYGRIIADHAVIAIWMLLIVVALVVMMMWGGAAVMVIGKRFITSQAGRKRSSFVVAAKQARQFVFPILFTEIVRTCTIILMLIPSVVAGFFALSGLFSGDVDGSLFTLVCIAALVLTLPALIYGIQTSMYQIAIVCEGYRFRESLKRSKALVKGRTWSVLWRLILLSLLLFIPIAIVVPILETALWASAPEAVIATDILDAVLSAFATILYTLCILQLYKALMQRPTEVKPDPVS